MAIKFGLSSAYRRTLAESKVSHAFCPSMLPQELPKLFFRIESMVDPAFLKI
jgi:hypothetical protein